MSGEHVAVTLGEALRCPDCGGNGVYPPPYERRCESCDGKGLVTPWQPTPSGEGTT